MNIAQAKQIDLVDYLASLGYNPSKIERGNYWYKSPLRDERTASFKINRSKNVWYDHGIGKGGDLLAFGMLYHDCNIKEVLEKLGGSLSFHPRPIHTKVVEDPVIKIISERNLGALPLLRYLRQRRIADDVARKYCREISFTMNDKQYVAIGFKNNSGGFELRNQWFKGSCSPKAITTFEQGSKQLSVFEGFFNFLSHQTIHKNQHLSPSNFLVLNSASFFENSREVMDKHESIHLFMDRDNTGQKCTIQALSWGSKYKDESSLYEGYNDLNEWIQQIGKSIKKGLSQK